MDDGEEVEFGPLDVGDIPPGHDAWVVGDEPVHILDFAGSSDAIGMPREHERIVTTLLMTDIVDSTRTASRLGDAAWKQLLSDHNRLVRAQLVRFGGSEVNTTGDGFLATFRSAVAGLRCAAAILEALRETGIEVRIGVHTGEVEMMGNDVGGVAVHAAARIMAPRRTVGGLRLRGDRRTRRWERPRLRKPGCPRSQGPGSADRGLPAPLIRPRDGQWGCGAPDRIRTCDLRLRRPTLYPLSYRRHARMRQLDVGSDGRRMVRPRATQTGRPRGAEAKAPAEAGALIAAGFANRKGIFHARFPALP